MDNEVKKWREQAEEDIDSAKFNLEGGKYKVASFLAQQAVEKFIQDILMSFQLKILEKNPLDW